MKLSFIFRSQNLFNKIKRILISDDDDETVERINHLHIPLN